MAGSIVAVDWTLGVQAVNFLIFMVLIDRFLFKPLLGLMDEREKELESHYLEIEELKKKAGALLEEVDRTLDQARARAKMLVDDAVKSARFERERILEEAQKKAVARLETARREIWDAFEREKKRLEVEVEKIAEEIVRKILGRVA
jgi:F-type H+-transporting ATPase subunit b